MVLATAVLVYSAWGSAAKIAAALVYGASSVLLFSASSLYHIMKKSENERSIWRTVDHMSIYILIAGTYTPICLLALGGILGISILCIQWGLALAGFVSELFWKKRPRWISTVLYLVMGWVAIGAIVPLTKIMSFYLLSLLFGAGIIYSIGAVIYALKKPDPFPGVFGFHEIFHFLVLLANGTFCLMIYNIIKIY